MPAIWLGIARRAHRLSTRGSMVGTLRFAHPTAPPSEQRQRKQNIKTLWCPPNPFCLWCPMLRISRDLAIDENDIEISFVRASGPGGQNVNKLSTSAQLRFDASRLALPEDATERLARLAGQRMTK